MLAGPCPFIFACCMQWASTKVLPPSPIPRFLRIKPLSYNLGWKAPFPHSAGGVVLNNILEVGNILVMCLKLLPDGFA